jgi:hypothetical protein
LEEFVIRVGTVLQPHSQDREDRQHSASSPWMRRLM